MEVQRYSNIHSFRLLNETCHTEPVEVPLGSKNIRPPYKLLFLSIALKTFTFFGFPMPMQVKLQFIKKR